MRKDLIWALSVAFTSVVGFFIGASFGYHALIMVETACLFMTGVIG